MGDGTFCRICHRLMVPNNERICGECQDAMKRAGYVKVVMCRDCKYAHLTYDGECKYCDMEADDEGNIPERYRPWDWYCADGEGIKNEDIDRKATDESSEATCGDPAHCDASDIRG